MSTADTNNIGIKLQAAGENLNTWGDPNLNNDLIVLSNITSKTTSLTINGTYTVSESNYSTSNDTENGIWKLIAGTVAAAFNFIIPARYKRAILWNTSGYTATAKLSASTGFSLPTGGIAWLSCDTVDVYNVSPTHCGTTTQASDSNAYALWGAVQTAIATAGLPATAGTVLVSGTDTTAKYLASAVTSSIGTLTTNQVSGLNTVQLSTVHGGGVEQVMLTLGGGYVGGFLYGGRKAAPFTAVEGTHYDVISGCTFLLPSAPSQSAKVSIALFGPTATYGIDPNGNKINNSTSVLTVLGGESFFATYDTTLGDWE